MSLPYGGAAVINTFARHFLRRRPLDRDGVAFHGRKLAAIGDCKQFPIHARLELAIHGIHKVVAVELRVKTQDTAAKQTVNQLGSPRANGECLGIGPGDMPESDNRCARQQFTDHTRQEGEMVILDNHDGGICSGFLLDSMRELSVDRRIVVPIVASKSRTHVGNVAQGPQPLVGKTVVVSNFLLFRQPDTPELVGRIFRRHRYMPVPIHHLPVGRTGTMCNPDPGTGTHHRLKRSYQSARRPLHLHDHFLSENGCTVPGWIQQ